MTTKDRAHLRFTLDVVLDANGEDHDYLGQRMNSAFAQAIGNGALTGDTGAEVDSQDAMTTLLTASAAGLDEDQVANWIGDQLESGGMLLEDVPKLMARYALTDSAQMRDEFVERMGLDEDESPQKSQVKAAAAAPKVDPVADWVACDIARIVGAEGLSHGGDSRSDAETFHAWAAEFQSDFSKRLAIGEQPGETYFEDLESFTLSKAKDAGFSQRSMPVAHERPTSN